MGNHGTRLFRSKRKTARQPPETPPRRIDTKYLGKIRGYLRERKYCFWCADENCSSDPMMMSDEEQGACSYLEAIESRMKDVKCNERFLLLPEGRLRLLAVA